MTGDPPEFGAARRLDPDAATRRREAAIAATTELQARFSHRLGLRYGPDERQVLHVYQPRMPSTGAVMAFVHGGGFRLGSPDTVGHHGRAVLEAGGTFVTIGYRLAPATRFPTSADDVESALEFVVQHADELGIDPARCYLSGHSAGAALAGLVALRPRSSAARALRGVVLVSGLYDFDALAEDVVDRGAPSYVAHLATAIERVPPETIVVVGEHDLPPVAPAAEALMKGLEAAGATFRFFVEPGADHFQAIAGFETPGEPVATAVEELMGLTG